MHKSEVAGLCLLALAGCARQPSAVYVDLDKVLDSQQISTPAKYVAPVPPAAFASSTLSFPALPTETYSLGSDKQRIKQVEDVLRKSREDALAQIAASLKQTYRKDLDHTETLELDKLKPGQQAEYQKAFDAARQAFEAYALKRGPLLAHLSVLVGFPDPDPTSQQPPPKTAIIATKRFETAKQLRAQIAALDVSYRSQSEALYSQAGQEVAAAVKVVQDKFEKLRAAADLRAGQEADAEVSREQEQLKSVLADRETVSFPAQAGRTVTVQGSQSPPIAPSVTVPGRDKLLAEQREADASDLKIWAALNGYVISSDHRHARDATAEFIRWEQSRTASP